MIGTIARFILILGLVCLFIGGGVAVLFAVLKGDIEVRDLRAREEAAQAVAPDGAAVDLQKPIAGQPSAPDAVYAAKANGRTVAYVAQGAAQGYSSVIQVMVGVRAEDLAIIRVVVLAQQETPGLGANVAEHRSNFTLWEKLFGPSEAGKTEQLVNPFLDRFGGKTRQEVPDIQGITAATITSNATKDAVGQALERIRAAVTSQKAEGAD